MSKGVEGMFSLGNNDRMTWKVPNNIHADSIISVLLCNILIFDKINTIHAKSLTFLASSRIRRILLQVSSNLLYKVSEKA